MNKSAADRKKRKVLIAPSLLSADFMSLAREIEATGEAGADLLHVDIMDGHFVPNMTIGPFIVEAIRKTTSLPLDVHLMIERPERYIDDFIGAGADFVSVHMEASVHLNRILNHIKEKGAKAGVALNPATPVSCLASAVYDLDFVLIMSVNPGFGGQAFIPHSLEKIKETKKLLALKNPSALIEVDGGVKPDNFRTLADCGADILVMGSAFYLSGDYKALVQNLRRGKKQALR
ncbi:MAG: ribulose-phosphate 3-epimerase [Nitrospiraceae bacterium]|nr:ribulose-phosphate 3-epimerase [Nitrospiraceae bacterium]